MSWFSEAFGRLATALQRWAQPGTFKATFMGRDVEYFQHDMRKPRDPQNMSIEELWATQPHLRTVVDFRARNIAQLGVQLFKADGEQRARVRGTDVSKLLGRPNPYMTGYDLIYDLVATRSLYDTAYWFIMEGESGKVIHPFPPSWVTPYADSHFGKRSYRVQVPGADRFVDVPGDQVVEFRGWTPTPSLTTSSPVETLRMVLEEQYSSRKHRLQLWRRNGRVGTYIARPSDAPGWDNTARRRFMDMFTAFTGDNAKAGGVPLLEDGMELKRNAFTSADEQWAESVKISLETVAQVYQVNPTMVGVLDGTNYSNMKEFNKALFRTSLGPDIVQIEERITEFVLPMLEAPGDQFVKLNVESMLRGSFEEQASVMSRAVGGPYMTRNEARALNDMPPVEGGDELIVPKNVSEGGQSSPMDGGDGRPEELES